MSSHPCRSSFVRGLVVASIFAAAANCELCQAQGNRGKGKKVGEYTLIPLPHESGSVDHIGYANGFRQVLGGEGAVLGAEVVGISSSRAHYWMLDASGNVAVATGLPFPIGSDPATSVTDAKDINDSGIIVGSGNGVPLVWPDLVQPPNALDLPTGFVGTGVAVDINNHGLVVGWLNSGSERSIVAWGLKGDGTSVGPVVLGSDVDAWSPDANDAGTVVGTVQYQAYRWQLNWNGTDLSASPAEALAASGFALQTATGINERGDICGRYSPDGNQTYLLTVEGTLIDMPALVDSGRHATRNIGANDLNDAGLASEIQVVGEANVYRKKGTPIIDRLGVEVLWQGGNTTDLEKATSQPTSDLALQWVGTISDAGWMTGLALTNDDVRDDRPVVLIPN